MGTNPFLVGNEADEGNWFYDILKQNEGKVHCFLLNTGGVGEIRERDEQGRSIVKQQVLRIAIEEMASMIRGIARDSIQWETEPYFHTQVPKRVDGLDLEKFNLVNYYTQAQIEEYVANLRQERRAWLARFPGLREEVVNAYA